MTKQAFRSSAIQPPLARMKRHRVGNRPLDVNSQYSSGGHGVEVVADRQERADLVQC
jgi:hypothetical protein